jgi:hypothetical protein
MRQLLNPNFLQDTFVLGIDFILSVVIAIAAARRGRGPSERQLGMADGKPRILPAPTYRVKSMTGTLTGASAGTPSKSSIGRARRSCGSSPALKTI